MPASRGNKTKSVGQFSSTFFARGISPKTLYSAYKYSPSTSILGTFSKQPAIIYSVFTLLSTSSRPVSGEISSGSESSNSHILLAIPTQIITALLSGSCANVSLYTSHPVGRSEMSVPVPLSSGMPSPSNSSANL